jgi:Ser-Thr-rich glycosyl-phosphatidyl-inositol-anchored membrane family/CARDB/FG-GAP-like repeat
MPDSIGNTFSTATAIPVNPGKYGFDRTEQVGSSDPLDIYKFTLAGKSSFSAAAVDLTGDVSLTLFSGTTAIATSNSNSSKGSETLSTDLAAGTYYLQISANNSLLSDYRLLVETQSTPKANVVWRNGFSGVNAAWQLNGSAIAGVETYMPITDPSWAMVGVSDFNGDGQTDYLWRQAATGTTAIWEMNGSAIGRGHYLSKLPSDWSVNQAADLNNDGKGDILWQNAQGQNLVWYMDGGTLLGSENLLTVADRNWRMEAAGDFNYDGKTDLLWRNYATGVNAAWLMNGSQITGTLSFLTINDRSWTIEGAGDFNDDGKVDILWRHTSGTNVTWNLNGNTIISNTSLLSVPDPSWQIMGVGKRFETPIAADLPGNSQALALNLGDLTGLTAGGTVRVGGSVSGSDPADYYRFTLTGTTIVDMVLDSAIDSVRLITPNTSVIQQGGTSSQTLQAGTYYLQVNPATTGKANYFLNLTARIPDPNVLKYNFTYYYNGADSKADYYNGWVYADEGSYTVNGWVDPKTAVNETGVNGKYMITSSSLYGTRTTVGTDRGKVFVSSYTDIDRSDPNAYTPNSTLQNKASGSNYLGSEFGEFGAGGMDFDFGEDSIEFDAKPDIVVTNVDVRQTQATPGSTVTISWQLRNLSNQSTQNGFRGAIYISQDSTITKSDYLLGLGDFPILGANGISQIYSGDFTLPKVGDSLWSGNGTYYIGFIADTANVIAESYETNNANRGQGIDWDSFTLTVPTITVNSPNGGETLRPGSTVNLTWSDNLAENVRIELYKGTTLAQTIATSVASNGLYNWVLPTNLVYGSDYKLRITSVNDAGISDYSNQAFSIGSTFNIQFDYRFDSINWYTTARRAALDAAADFWERIILDEFADTPIGTAVPYVNNPSTDQNAGVNNIFTTDVAIDDLLVFVGTQNMSGGNLAEAGPSGYYTNDTRYVGEDFEPRIGSLTFNNAVNWFIDSTPATRNDIPTNQFDFIGTAIHELGHILGFSRGIYAFERHVVNGVFMGPNAKLVNGGLGVPLSADGHIQEGYTYGNYGESSLDPTTMAGVRQLPTLLDMAILDDVGYTINYAMASNN